MSETTASEPVGQTDTDEAQDARITEAQAAMRAAEDNETEAAPSVDETAGSEPAATDPEPDVADATKDPVPTLEEPAPRERTAEEIAAEAAAARE